MGRPQPALPAHAFKTYAILAPAQTHFREATCEEVDCPAQANGFKTLVHEGSELGQQQAHYIRKESGRFFLEERMPDGMTAFTFPAGQRCFRDHRVRLDRDPIFLRRLGDHRGDPSRARPFVHARPEDWVDDFAGHQDRLNRAVNG
jgi:hypothetical protein